MGMRTAVLASCWLGIVLLSAGCSVTGATEERDAGSDAPGDAGDDPGDGDGDTMDGSLPGDDGSAGDGDDAGSEDAGSEDAGQDAGPDAGGQYVCATRVIYGPAWFHPEGHPHDYDDTTGHVTWDGLCQNDGVNSFAVLSNGWKPFFMGLSSCSIMFQYTYCPVP
jgi:hypothetical protein